MTIGIAALAERSRNAGATGTGARAIVLVADRQMTWGEDDLREESEIEKRRALVGSWQMLYSGDPDDAEEVADAMRALRPSRVRKVAAMRQFAKEAYRGVRERSFDDEVLRPRQLTLADVSGARLGRLPDALLVDYLRAKVEWERDFGAELIFAGFDELRRGTLFSFSDPGVLSGSATDTFQTIGSGAGIARTRLIRLRARASDPAHVALYKCLDAKFHAELAATVGPGTDAWIVLPSRTARYHPHKVRTGVVRMLRNVFDAETGSAFENRRHLRPDWKVLLERYVNEVLAGRKPSWPPPAPRRRSQHG